MYKGKTLLSLVNKSLGQKVCCQHPAMFCQKKDKTKNSNVLDSLKVMGSNPGYHLKSSLLYNSNSFFFQMDLTSFVDKRGSECLNESDDHPYAHCLTPGGGYLESDCDEQLILALTFNQSMKIHSLKIKAPSDKGPKTVRIFQNQPNTLDFDKADSMVSVQDLE